MKDTESQLFDHQTVNNSTKGTILPKNDEESTKNPPSNETLMFFNYHEYSVRLYRKLQDKFEDVHDDKALIVTHFPNVYVSRNSAGWKTTRIVRVPRTFNSKGLLYPEFSTVLPGKEEAAIYDEEDGLNGIQEDDDDIFDEKREVKNGKLHNDSRFVPRGVYENQLYGYSSVSPLSNYINEDDFTKLISEINNIIRSSYSIWTFYRILEYFLDLLTFWILSDLVRPTSKRNLDELEIFIQEKNKELIVNHNIKIISPRRSGFLSLDFEIPRPEL